MVSEIRDNYARVMERVSTAAQKSGRGIEDIIIVGASKTKPAEIINEAIAVGLRYIGENRAQEVTQKYDKIIKPEGFHEHFIGRLQSNKIKYIHDKVDMIQSVDRMSIAHELSDFMSRHGTSMDILLQVNIAKEESKGGFLKEELDEAVSEISCFSGLRIRGLMAVPPVHQPGDTAYDWFNIMNKLLVDIKGKKYDNVNMEFLSMGMSHDFEDAIMSGSNMVRIGSAIFGERDYKI